VGTKPTEPRRRLKRIDVVEISPVTFPANAKAKVTNVKSIERSPRCANEDFLCAAACRKRRPLALIARIKGIDRVIRHAKADRAIRRPPHGTTN
jgi:hypothetical protein